MFNLIFWNLVVSIITETSCDCGINPDCTPPFVCQANPVDGSTSCGCANSAGCPSPLKCYISITSGIGSCYECLTNADCKTSGLLICDLTGSFCRPCTNNDCSGATPVCDNETTGNCVQCLVNRNCSGNTPVCGSSNVCGPCRSDSDCASLDRNRKLKCNKKQGFCHVRVEGDEI